uniref:Paraneoplastic antigen Ma-like C-terminal domain-containing protein n=1 Tax=Meloidogyne enterolobii TaxID=390850 RepID=A0A6V7XH68_MELEN|nr:unnamed protein product [Meloidogyne enterolobii]
MSDFDEKFFSKEENKQFGPILVRLREFEKSVAHSLREINSNLEELNTKENQTKNSLTATKGSITKMSNKIWEKLKEIENKLNDNTQDDLEASNNDEFQETFEEPEIAVSDPFLNNGVYVGNFDGNPTVSFSKWIEKFEDVLSLVTTPLTEQQKILRLRFCLSGQARVALDTMQPQPENLAVAIANLKAKFENGNTKVIARQKLSNCRQAPGESVFDFANRLSDLVRTALVGETENTIKNSLLYEFLDRLIPDLKFQVKSQRPTEYTNAYELALHFELLLAEKKPDTSVCVSKVAEEVESLVFQRNHPKTCFNCKSSNHLVNSCPKRRNNFNNNHINNSNGYRPNYNKDNRYDSRERCDYSSPSYGDNQNYSGYQDYPDHYGASHNRNYQNRSGYREYPDSRSPSRERIRINRDYENSYGYSKYPDSRSPSRERYDGEFRRHHSNYLHSRNTRDYISPHSSPSRVRYDRSSPDFRAYSPYFTAVIEPCEYKITRQNLKENSSNKLKSKLPHQFLNSVRFKNINSIRINKLKERGVEVENKSNNHTESLAEIAISKRDEKESLKELKENSLNKFKIKLPHEHPKSVRYKNIYSSLDKFKPISCGAIRIFKN